MTDPFIRPEPTPFPNVPSWIMPNADPSATETWRDRDRQPPPLGRQPQAVEPDDDDYEWVPRGGERLGWIRVRRR